MGHGYVQSKAARLAGPAVGLLIVVGGLAVGTGSAYAACPAYSASQCQSAPTSAPDGLAGRDGTPTAASGSTLAFTGSDVAVTATVGAGAIAAGGIIVLASRRRRVQD